MAKPGIVPLSDKSSDVILAHILDPDSSPLSAKQQEEFNRVVQAAKLLDDYPNDRHVLQILRQKYNVSVTQLRTDIAHAKELFKTEHTFDYDMAFSWMLKDQIELILECKLRGDFKNWNAAKKVLREMIGEKPVTVEDPRRMMKNQFFIQINNGTGQPVNIPLDKLRGLAADEIQIIQQSLVQPIADDTQAEEIFNS